MDLKDGWIKNDFQWIRRRLISKPLCVDQKLIQKSLAKLVFRGGHQLHKSGFNLFCAAAWVGVAFEYG